MGCCQSKGKLQAFRSDLDTPLIDDLAPKLGSDSKVVVVRLIALRDIQIGNSYSGLTDSFVEFKVRPDDKIAGAQKQLSSIKPSSLSPKWDPPERFQFAISNPQDSKIVLSVYQFNANNPQDSSPLGDSQLKVKDFLSSSGGTDINKVLKLINPKDGKGAGEAEVSVTILTLEEACSIQEHTVYEFQRLNLVLGWGNQAPPMHLLPTDPGAWSTENGKNFNSTIEGVAPPIPPGWEVTKHWRTYATDEEAEGWQYSTVFDSPFWYPKNDSSLYVVRRRTWHREIRRTAGAGSSSGSNRNSTSSTDNKNSGRRRRMFSSDKNK